MSDILQGFRIRGDAVRRMGTDPPSVVRIIQYLDRLPPDKLLHGHDLCDALKLGRQYLRGHADRPSLQPYRIRVPHVSYVLWGSQKAIAEVRRRQKRAEEGAQATAKDLQRRLHAQR